MRIATLIRFVVAVAISAIANAQSLEIPKPPLLLPYALGFGQTPNLPGLHSQAVPVRFNAPQMLGLSYRSEVQLTLPNAQAHAIVFELAQAHGDGIHSWVGHFKETGSSHRVIVTTGPGGSYGVIETPGGSYRLVPGDGHDWLVDMTQEGPHIPPLDLGDDGIRPPAQPKARTEAMGRPEFEIAIPGVNSVARPKATPTPQALVDLMVVYTQGLASRLGVNLMTRLNFLVTRANTAYADSEIAITLRLVGAAMVNYSDATANNTALNDITNGSGVFSGVAALRTAAGADAVALLMNGSDFGGSGIAWVPNPTSAGFMYSVTKGCVLGCESVFIHEVGHNMGNAHDRATAAWQAGGVAIPPPGIQSYSFGHFYCASGLLSCNPNVPSGSGGCASQPECSTTNASNFATIMSYFQGTAQTVYKFSNPNVSCAAAGGDGIPRPCGVASALPNSADTAASMNGNRFVLSGLLGSVSGASLPGSLQFTALSYSGSEAGGTLTFTVSRVGGSAGAVSVNYATSDGTALAGLDYAPASGTLNWANGDSADKTFNVTIFNDGVTENGESFSAALSGPAGAPGVFLGYPGSAAGIIYEAWPPGGTIPAGFVTPGASSGAWNAATDQVFEGTHSLRSAQVYGSFPANYVNSDLTYTGTFVAGNVAFAYRVSSWANPGFVSYGIFEFLVDGVAVLTDAGESGWKSFSYPITGGVHTLVWRFRNALPSACNGGWNPPAPGGASCADRAWIDALALPLALAGSGTTLGASPNPSGTGQSVTFTATVTGGAGTPTGNVVFRDGATPIAGCSAVPLAAGVAQCMTSALPAGIRSITAQYSGNATYNPSTSTPLNQTVNAFTNPAFADFNADGRPDIIWSNTASGATYIWRMFGPALLSDSFLATIDPSWRIQGVADFNGDGHPDVVWRNTANGNCYVWYLV
ncbi:MAG: Ig-like domain repeat protein, partial [Burkholderiales bacterium]